MNLCQENENNKHRDLKNVKTRKTRNLKKKGNPECQDRIKSDQNRNAKDRRDKGKKTNIQKK